MESCGRATTAVPVLPGNAGMNAEILGAGVDFVPQPFLTPLIISSGAITEITEAVATVTVRVDGRTATGRGSIYLSDLWAWPEPALTHAQRDAALRALCRDIAANFGTYGGGAPAHPLELGLRLHASVCHASPSAPPPVLARAMAASPFDAAIHDAAGQALQRSAFDFYQTPCPIPSADAYFDGDAVGAVRAVIAAPKRELKAWYVVCKPDDRETLRPWVQARGYRCFKLKLLGRDNAYDVGRTVEVFRWVTELGARRVELSVDTNEANPSAESVADYYARLRAASPEAFAALQYFEQPTGRDITVHAFDWTAVGTVKPVLLDEGLTDLALMETARRQGWTGFALKTCKGHSFALVAAAWARRHGMPLSLQDLTNPGLALIHAALFAAHVHTINDVELNSPQFTPAANAPWHDRLPGLFDPRHGVHRLADLHPAGLGSTL